jgi:acyl carrier protein
MNDTSDRRQHNVSAPFLLSGRQVVLDLLFAAISGMMADWDRDDIPPLSEETLLVADLGFQSLDIVVLMGNMSRQLSRTDIPFERLLFLDGRPILDLSLRVLTDFLWEQAGRAPARL